LVGEGTPVAATPVLFSWQHSAIAAVTTTKEIAFGQLMCISDLR